MKSLLNKFNQVDLQGRIVLVHEFGEYISTGEYYSMKVNLYTMPGFLVELFYDPHLNKIDRIEIVNDNKPLNKYLTQIEISDIRK